MTDEERLARGVEVGGVQFWRWPDGDVSIRLAGAAIILSDAEWEQVVACMDDPLKKWAKRIEEETAIRRAVLGKPVTTGVYDWDAEEFGPKP